MEKERENSLSLLALTLAGNSSSGDDVSDGDNTKKQYENEFGEFDEDRRSWRLGGCSVGGAMGRSEE